MFSDTPNHASSHTSHASHANHARADVESDSDENDTSSEYSNKNSHRAATSDKDSSTKEYDDSANLEDDSNIDNVEYLDTDSAPQNTEEITTEKPKKFVNKNFKKIINQNNLVEKKPESEKSEDYDYVYYYYYDYVYPEGDSKSDQSESLPNPSFLIGDETTETSLPTDTETTTENIIY